ncbi:Copper binding protein CusF [Modicisalibacter ilicicola DSM 19980]|uniref:Copper binding protein CusF n=1 Tax=Modicisalibacter ilicicola DSM 19980 TaxID=1121942 RepID=A0A1M5BCN6_9GAMM|nr:copper-binding protein [Halomonas ilicicola]SHF40188.1 Copper binding protein CusF [Halomonas ilicicola DSM 19980]
MTNAIRYMLTTAALSVAFMTLPASAETNHDDQKHGSEMHQSANAQTAQGQGTVKALDTEKQQITLTHGPIESLGWPGMTMPFKLADSASMKELSVGDEVRFEVKKSGNDITITEISRQ